MTDREISIAFQTNKSAAQYIKIAKLVNQYDFDAVSVYCDAPYHPSYGPLLLMAPHIKRARIGPAAVSPSRIHPIDIASQSALLAQVAPGGTYIGIARGAWLEAHGIKEVLPPLRAIREAVEVVRYLLSGRSDGYSGKVFNIAEHVKAPYPLPEKQIPLLIGTWGKKLCGIAGEIADEVKIGGTANPDVIPVIRGYIAVGEQRAGRTEGSAKIAVGAVTVIDQDRKLARQIARRELALYLPVVARLDPTVQLDPELQSKIGELADQRDFESAGRLISDELLDRFALAGSAEDIIRQSELLFEAGVDRIEFGTPHGLEPENGISLLGEKVLPNLKR